MFLVGLPIGIAIGIVLGLVGAGGALLATPLFVLVAKFNFAAASTAALFVVLFASVTALAVREKEKLQFKIAATAILLGSIGSIPGAWLATQISELASSIVLISVLALASFATWNSEKAKQIEDQKQQKYFRVALFVFAGFLTGLTGVGGGFILIPGLLILTRLKFRAAVSLSLLVVIGNSLISLTMRLSQGVRFDSEQSVVIALVVMSALIGSAVGARLSSRLNRKLVQRFFSVLAALLMVVVAIEATNLI